MCIQNKKKKRKKSQALKSSIHSVLLPFEYVKAIKKKCIKEEEYAKSFR